MDQDKNELIGWLDTLVTDGQLQKLEREHYSSHPLTSPFGIQIGPRIRCGEAGEAEFVEAPQPSWDACDPDDRMHWILLDLQLLGKAAFERQISSRGKTWFLTSYKIWSACVDIFGLSDIPDVNLPRIEALKRAHRKLVDVFCALSKTQAKALPAAAAKDHDQEYRRHQELLSRVLKAENLKLTWWVNHRLKAEGVHPTTFWDYRRGTLKSKVSIEKRRAIESTIRADAARLGIQDGSPVFMTQKDVMRLQRYFSQFQPKRRPVRKL